MQAESWPGKWGDGESGAIRVVVVAPALAVRTGLRALLSALPQVEVIGEDANLEEMQPLPPGTDVLVLAVPAAGRVDLEQALFTDRSSAVLMLVSEGLEVDAALPDLPLRAWGILPIDTSAEELAAAVHALSEGLLVGAPGLVQALFLKSETDQEPAAEPLVEPLTEREAEVMQLLAQGLANKQIAVSLGISEHTVKFHISAIYGKLGVTSRTEAVRAGIQKGLVVL